MKRIFALSGPANTGKTNIIRDLYFDVCHHYVHEIKLYRELGKHDFISVIKIKEMSIGFITKGDPGTPLAGYLEELTQYHCSLIICSARTKGMTVEAVKSMDPAYKVRWIETKWVEKGKIESENLRLFNKVHKLGIDWAQTILMFSEFQKTKGKDTPLDI